MQTAHKVIPHADSWLTTSKQSDKYDFMVQMYTAEVVEVMWPCMSHVTFWPLSLLITFPGYGRDSLGMRLMCFTYHQQLVSECMD